MMKEEMVTGLPGFSFVRSYSWQFGIILICLFGWVACSSFPQRFCATGVMIIQASSNGAKTLGLSTEEGPLDLKQIETAKQLLSSRSFQLHTLQQLGWDTTFQVTPKLKLNPVGEKQSMIQVVFCHDAMDTAVLFVNTLMKQLVMMETEQRMAAFNQTIDSIYQQLDSLGNQMHYVDSMRSEEQLKGMAKQEQIVLKNYYNRLSLIKAKKKYLEGRDSMSVHPSELAAFDKQINLADSIIQSQMSTLNDRSYLALMQKTLEYQRFYAQLSEMKMEVELMKASYEPKYRILELARASY